VDKLERLLTLLLVLLETPRALSADELRERVGGYDDIDTHASFQRAFERDKDSLREMGVPVVVQLVPGADPPREGYRVRPEDYYLRDPGLDADELAALHLAATSVRLEGIQGMEGLWKLGGVIDPDAEVLAGGVANVRVDAVVPVLFEAVTEQRIVTFTYRDRQRRVEPYVMHLARGRWYLIGLDLDRVEGAEQRNFRVDRIQGDVASGTPRAFRRPAELLDVDREPWRFGGDPPVVARLLVDAHQAPWALQHLAEETSVEHRKDGSVVIELEVTNRQAFRSFALTFLDHAEILSPPELRADLLEWLGAVP